MASVFISHRSADQPAAERLAGDLRDHGHDVWLDTWKISIGDSIVERIDTGLDGARFLILCCSGAGPSPWMDREWMSALARQLDGVQVRVLPVVLAGGAVPGILADIKYGDLRVRWDDGVAALCQAMSG